jgi:hypothetical protein
MGKLKESLIKSEEDLAVEMWEHNVMAEVRDFVNLHGADIFKDALMTFSRETYHAIFHPQQKVETCYLTNPNH